MQLLIARHAETQWNVEKRIQGWTNSQLTSGGTQQAQALAKRLSKTKIHAIYSSDSQRAMRTAECVALYQNVDVVPLTDLRETCWGEWEGMTATEIEERFPELWAKFVARGDQDGEADADWDDTTLVPGGESHSVCANRIATALQQVRAKHPSSSERVLVVGHGGSLRFLLTHTLGIRPALARRFHLDNTSLSEIEFTSHHPPVIKGLNDVCHLVSLPS